MPAEPASRTPQWHQVPVGGARQASCLAAAWLPAHVLQPPPAGPCAPTPSSRPMCSNPLQPAHVLQPPPAGPCAPTPSSRPMCSNPLQPAHVLQPPPAGPCAPTPSSYAMTGASLASRGGMRKRKSSRTGFCASRQVSNLLCPHPAQQQAQSAHRAASERPITTKGSNHNRERGAADHTSFCARRTAQAARQLSAQPHGCAQCSSHVARRSPGARALRRPQHARVA